MLLCTASHSVLFGPFLSSSFFPPNDRAQEKPLLVLFLTLKLDEVGHKSYFLNRWMIWEVVGLEMSGDKWGLEKS
jgi:hypothetical protein